MDRMNWRRIGVCAVLAASTSAAALTYAKQGPDGVDENTRSFVRPENPDVTTREIFEDIGVNSVRFSFRTPPDKAAVFTTEARDADGKLIASLSQRAFVNPREPDGTARGDFRLTRIDPGATNENYKGKVRWLWDITGNKTSCWEVDHWSGSRSLWDFGRKVINLEPGAEYTLWEIASWPAGVKPHSGQPASFRMQIKFKLAEPQGPPTTISGHDAFRNGNGTP